MRAELAEKLRASQERMRVMLEGQAANSAAALETLRVQGEELHKKNMADATAWADAEIAKIQAQTPPRRG